MPVAFLTDFTAVWRKDVITMTAGGNFVPSGRAFWYSAYKRTMELFIKTTQAGEVRRIASAIAETGASSSNRSAARSKSEESSPFIPTHTLCADSCAGMKTSIVLAVDPWSFVREVPARGTNVSV